MKGAKIETIEKSKMTTIPNFALHGAEKKIILSLYII
jgi:hypothetical protein